MGVTSEFFDFSSMASTAFLTIFVIACDRRRRSQTSGSIPLGVLTVKTMSGFATSNRNTARRRISRASSTPNVGLGIRAKLENSSTMRRMSCTCRITVSVSLRKVAEIALDLVAEPPLKPFGRELDRGERILDLMRDTPRDVGPGGAPLVEQLLGDILETQREAIALRHRFGRERRGLGILARQLHDRLALVAGQQPRQFGRDIVQWSPGEAIRRLTDQAFRRGIGEQDAAVGVDRHDRRGYAAEHRLDKAAPCLELLVGVDRGAGLPFQLLGHPVEGAGQHRNLVVAGRRGNPDRKIAARCRSRGADQRSQWTNDPVGDDDRRNDPRARARSSDPR